MGSPIEPTQNKVTNPPPPVTTNPTVDPNANNVTPSQNPTETSAPVATTKANDLQFEGNLKKDQLTTQLASTGAPLGYLQPGVNGNPANVDDKKVDAAVSSIKSSLTQSWKDWDVSKGDLNNIQNQFKNLDAAETNAAFDKLTANDLKRWTSEMDGGINGFNAAEKKALYDDLAGKLNPDNAVRFLNSIDGKDDQQAFANSYANKASDANVENIINGTLGKVTTNERSASIVNELIGGLKGNQQAIDRVLGGMSQNQIDALVKEGVQHELHSHASPYGGGSVYTTNDPKPLAAVLDAVSDSNDPELKAKFFESAANQLATLENSGSLLAPTMGKDADAKVIRDALTDLLKSDTTGIMKELETGFRNGKGISSYAKSMLNAGEETELGNIIARLSKGNDLTQVPLDRFSAQVPGTDGKPHYNNAQTLGYFAGGLFSGAKQITNDRAKQADMIKNVFGTVAGAAGTANIPAGVASSILNGLTSEIVDSVTDSMNNGTMSGEEALENLLFPRSTTTGDLYEGAAEADYDSSFSRVVLRNQG